MATALGSGCQDSDLVFDRGDAQLIPGQGLRTSFRKLCTTAKVPLLRFHDLRYTTATLHMEGGRPAKVVVEMLGHSSAGITLALYSHVQPHVQEQAADRLEAVFSGLAQNLPKIDVTTD